MTFTLTESLTDEILSALENQEETFLVDVAQNKLVQKTDGLKGDEDLFYELPEWDSAAGFKLREDFVSRLNSPLAHEALQEVLHSGRGVFRNFRNVIKEYPEVEKRWHIYKNNQMLSYINDWYNKLREVWGLEKLDYVPESDDSLIHDDFSFTAYNQQDKEELVLHLNAAFREGNENLSQELSQALYNSWLEQFELAQSKGQLGFICRSFSNDFAGCITLSQVTTKEDKVMVMTSLFVPKAFRGLGIGTELINMCLSELKKLGKTWLIMPKMTVPEYLEPLLLRTGFSKIDFGYAVNF